MVRRHGAPDGARCSAGCGDMVRLTVQPRARGGTPCGARRSAGVRLMVRGAARGAGGPVRLQLRGAAGCGNMVRLIAREVERSAVT